MPATAGRVSMPKGNRVDTSASLRTTGIWANTIGCVTSASRLGVWWWSRDGAHTPVAARPCVRC